MAIFDFFKTREVEVKGKTFRVRVFNPYEFATKDFDGDLVDLFKQLEGGTDPSQLYRGWGKLAVDFIAFQVAKTKLKVYKKGEPVDQKDELFRLLQKPMVNFNFSSWIRLLMINLLSYGFAVVQMLPTDKNTRPISLRILPSKDISIKFATNPYVVEEVLYLGQPLNKDRIVQIVQFGLDGSIFSDLQNAAYPIRIARALDRWFYSFTQKGGILPMVFVVEEDISADEAEILKRKLKKQFAGEAGGMDVVVVNSKVDVVKTGMSPADVDLSKLQQFYRDMVLNLFGIGRFSIGEPDKSNRATAQEERKRLRDFVIFPRVKIVIDALQTQLVDRFYPEYQLDFEIPLVEESRIERAQYFQIATGGMPWMSPNEVRSQEGLEPLPGGDELVLMQKDPEEKKERVTEVKKKNQS